VSLSIEMVNAWQVMKVICPAIGITTKYLERCKGSEELLKPKRLHEGHESTRLKIYFYLMAIWFHANPILRDYHYLCHHRYLGMLPLQYPARRRYFWQPIWYMILPFENNIEFNLFSLVEIHLMTVIHSCLPDYLSMCNLQLC